MEIQQHDGVVVEVAGFQQGFAKRCGRREMCHGREREAPGAVVLLPSLPPLYIGSLGGRRPWEIPSPGGRRPREWLAPQAKWGDPTPRVSNPRRRGGPRGAPQPTKG